METKAEFFTSEQLQAFFFVIGFLIVTNAGAIFGYIREKYKKLDNMEDDLNEAFIKIRAIEKHLNLNSTEGEEDGQLRDSLQKQIP